MQPVEILVRANKLGIRLAAEGGYVVARPKGATPPDLSETIRRYKADLLAYLRAEQDRAAVDEALVEQIRADARRWLSDMERQLRQRDPRSP
jgi:hypothetical protein